MTPPVGLMALVLALGSLTLPKVQRWQKRLRESGRRSQWPSQRVLRRWPRLFLEVP
jgi:hypothetical protein